MLEITTLAPYESSDKLNKSGQPEYAVIWLHGLGADANDFIQFGQTLQQKIISPLRFIFPNAPARPVTINNGYVMRAWYDITGIGLQAREDRSGLDQTAEKILQLIDQQVQSGMPSERIFLGGFSQGGAASLYTGLRCAQKLAGLIAFSAYLPFAQETAQIMRHTMPVFWGHGLQDTVVLPQWGELSSQSLKSSGFPVEFHRYPMAHYVCSEEINDLAGWLSKKITF